MVNPDQSYETIALVIDSWEELKRIKNYEQVAGATLFLKLFEQCPETKSLFGYPVDMSFDAEDVRHNKRFLMHASYLIQMIDTAFNMLGPDSELLTEIMHDLGRKHKIYGVKPQMFAVMGECLVCTMKSTLGEDRFGEKEEAALRETYSELSGDMIDVLES